MSSGTPISITTATAAATATATAAIATTTTTNATTKDDLSGDTKYVYYNNFIFKV